MYRDESPDNRSAFRHQTLRLSVTESCNFRCRYCAPAIRAQSALPLPSLDRLADAAEWLVDHLALRRVRLTGGEPLARIGLDVLIRRLRSAEGVEEVTLTTNGSLLDRFAPSLKGAGLSRVNISLDTLDPVRFREICGGELSATLAGVDAALEAELTPVKLNAVLHRSGWRRDVPSLLDYAADKGLEIRFIELMKLGPAKEWAEQEYVPASEPRLWIERRTATAPVPHQPGSPSRLQQVKWNGRDLRVGWITPESETFCSGCDRLRLDCYGRLRRCLMDVERLPLLDLIEEYPVEEAVRAVDRYLSGKHPPVKMIACHSMLAVGG